VAATAKHFPGHGDTDTDSHLALPVVRSDRRQLETVELAPFRAAINAGIAGVMSAHIALPAVSRDSVPATLVPAIMSGLLRDTLGFDGLTVTDALTMQGIGQGYGVEASAVLSVQAGSDIQAARMRLAALLPAGVFVALPADADVRASNLSRAYRVNLNVLALVALFTGAFLVFSTQMLSVVRRRGEFALLRTLGWPARQLLRQIVVEGAAIGCLGSWGDGGGDGEGEQGGGDEHGRECRRADVLMTSPGLTGPHRAPPAGALPVADSGHGRQGSG